MRIVRFDPAADEDPRLGVEDREAGIVVDVSEAGDDLGVDLPGTVPALLARPHWGDLLSVVVDHARETGTGVRAREAVGLRAPIESPPKIVCVGLNYQEHVDEGGHDEAPDEPVLFSKFATAVVGPTDDIRWSPELTTEVDFEAELAAVIGEEARRVSPEAARDHVAGYAAANDVSARDLQFADDQWTRGKTLDTFCPLGPALVTADEVGDPHDLDLWTEVNGERLQESNTGNMIFDVDTIVSYCSDAFTLTPGDVILTGTPPGVGVFRDPPRLLDDGDEVVVAVEGIGELRNECRHE